MINRNTGLGRGLDALISVDDSLNESNAPSSINEVEIDLIHANPDQPRKDFDEQALQELADSIRSIGIIQPITLRQEEDGTYMIIAGERRFRASQLAGRLTIPAYIRKASDDDVMEMALIENIQREDLNAIEVALAYQQLQTKSSLTQDELSQRVGKSRSSVANFMRLLKLPAEVQIALKEKRLSMGHARAMLPVEDPEQQVKLYHLTIEQDFTVRKVEQLVRDYQEGRILDFSELQEPAQGSKPSERTKTDSAIGDYLNSMADHLSDKFGAKVRMSCNDKGKGKITIAFANDQQFQTILSLLDKIEQ